MSWLELPPGTDFGLANLPYGVFSGADGVRRCGVRVGERVLDLAAALEDDVFAAASLNAFLAGGREVWSRTRARVTELLTTERHRVGTEAALRPLRDVALHLPVEVADYVDFYASLDHASNIGRILRPDGEPLTPNWRHLPIGYHGRAGTIVVSGTPIRRPCGQRKGPAGTRPDFGPTRRLDIEAELAFVVGVPSRLGDPVPAAGFREHVFGALLLNDWSARDIQAWEYVPLGPFLGKSFATSVSPWVVPLDALESARVPPRRQDPEPLPYLADPDPWSLEVELEVRLGAEVVSRPAYASMYWTPGQLLAHLTANGASLRTGDLYASGTISGPDRGQRGSLIELSWNGAEPIVLADGSSRSFLADGDSVTITASAPGAAGERVGFGEVRGDVEPARATR